MSPHSADILSYWRPDWTRKSYHRRRWGPSDIACFRSIFLPDSALSRPCRHSGTLLRPVRWRILWPTRRHARGSRHSGAGSYLRRWERLPRKRGSDILQICAAPPWGSSGKYCSCTFPDNPAHPLLLRESAGARSSSDWYRWFSAAFRRCILKIRRERYHSKNADLHFQISDRLYPSERNDRRASRPPVFSASGYPLRELLNRLFWQGGTHRWETAPFL